MKFTFIFLMVFVVQLSASVYSPAYAQPAKLKVEFKEATIKEVIDEIEKQTDLTFFFSGDVLNTGQTITLKARDTSVDEILDLVSEQTGLSITIVRDQILVKKNLPAKDVLFQQQKTVSGKVTDSGGQPLPGVTVVVKGTTQGTVTNVDGEYALSNISEDGILMFSFVGMKMQEIPVSGKTSVNVTMVKETIGIDEVVAIGYGTVRKSDLTGSVVSVKSEDLEKIPVTNISQAIQGRAVGVNIRQNQTSPGGGISIRVRGISSFKGNVEPLYVIDGVIGGNINTINPSDIKSIEILKDASSTAIYGTSGANGVILVTTKTGKIGKSTFSFDGYYGVQSITRELELMNSKEWAELENDRMKYSGVDFRWDPDDQIYTDWQDEIYRIAPIYNFKLSSSGGTSKLRYFTSADYIKQNGIVINTDFDRFNFRLNLDSEVNDHITIGSRIGVSRYYRNRLEQEDNPRGQNAILLAAMLPPNINPYDENGNLRPTIERYWWWVDSWGPERNPIYQQQEIIDESKTNAISGSVFTEIEFLKNFKFRPSFNYNMNSTKSGFFKPSTVYDGDYRNKASIGFVDSESWNADLLLSYQNTFNNQHNIKLLAGYIVTNSHYESSSTAVHDFADDVFQYHSIGSGETIRSVGSGYSKKTGLGYIFRGEYNYGGKYYFSFNSRYDGSSVMGLKNTWGYFPSGAVMWKLSEEPFLKNSRVFHNTKLRASYGISGSDALGAYASQGKLSGALNRGYAFD
ncbi:SusC/RagA family TonB-linked outer membrane protein, partial [Mariniphaga sediminis]|uniref:SusC/RagA family TonB-linked outer membrane protein n=1 Tax=Mariniphaga sediminis TaxID=1628158 RepID=UPI003564B1AD